MFTTPKTPQEFFKAATDFFAIVPKTPEDAKVVMEKVQNILKTEYENGQDMVKTYQKTILGNATANELADANKKATELAKFTAFAGLVAIPGAVFVLPAIVEKAKEHKIDLVPKSVAEQFNI